MQLTSNGDPVFIDYCGKTVNLVKNSQRHTIIKQKGWIPLSVCTTSSDNLLVVLASDDIKQETKVVLYSDSTENKVFSTMTRENLCIHPVVVLNASMRTGI